jgi:hypothetical protein
VQLVIGARHITPHTIRRIAGGVEAVLKGDALRALLDSAFHGRGTIEILGGDLHRRRVEVTGIEMSGSDTRVTLICQGIAAALH